MFKCSISASIRAYRNIYKCVYMHTSISVIIGVLEYVCYVFVRINIMSWGQKPE